MIRTLAPAAVRLSVALWLVAIGLGATEALVRLTLSEPPTPAQLAARFVTYAVLVVLVLALRAGHNLVRWTVTVLLGGVGTFSLVADPVSWLLAGGSPLVFVTGADGPTLVVAALRAAHLAAVLAALALLFDSTADSFFRPRFGPRDTGRLRT